MHFYRDNNGFEVDLILEKGHKELELFEIKPAYTISKVFKRNMERFESLHPGYGLYMNIDADKATQKGNSISKIVSSKEKAVSRISGIPKGKIPSDMKRPLLK